MKPPPSPILSSTTLLVLLSLTLANDLQAQTSDGTFSIPANQIRFAGTALMTERLQLNHLAEPILMSKPGLGVEGSVTYSRHIISGFRANIGLSLSIIPFNQSYHFADQAGEVHTTRGITFSYIQWLHAIPITIQKTFALRPDQRWQLSLESGIRLNYSDGPGSYRAGASFSGGPDPQRYNMRYERPDRKRFVSYLFKAGVMKFGSKGNAIHCNLIYHHSRENIGTGTYEFLNIGHESFGTVEHRAESLGLEIGYSVRLFSPAHLRTQNSQVVNPEKL